MPAPLPLTSAAYPAIRAALDVSLDDTLLPDAVIGLDIYQTAGERDVELADPQSASRTGTAATAIQNAAVFAIAARLAPAIPVITAEKLGASSIQREPTDWTALAGLLRARMAQELATILQVGIVPQDRPRFFARAHGCRGR